MAPREEHPPPRRHVERPEEVEERALPGAGRAGERDELAVRDVEVDPAEHLEAPVAHEVGLREPLDPDERLGGRGAHSALRPSTGRSRAALVAG